MSAAAMPTHRGKTLGQRVAKSVRRLGLWVRCKAAYLRSHPPRGGHATVLFHPESPRIYTVAYRVCHLNGYRITADPRRGARAAFFWHDVTFRKPDAALEALAGVVRVVNGNCLDISKENVDRVQRSVFGYGLGIDPEQHSGLCVRKSDENGTHNGVIVACPRPREPGFVYQRVVNNRIDGGLVEDIRLPVFDGAVPFCYLKFRPAGDRFSNTNSRVSIVETAQALSAAELERVRAFSAAMGLDYGEMDALRDRDDGRLYVVDVNSTPFGPPNHIGAADGDEALRRLAAAFGEAFVGR